MIFTLSSGYILAVVITGDSRVTCDVAPLKLHSAPELDSSANGNC